MAYNENIFSVYDLNDFIISCGVKAHVIKNYFANYDNYNADYKIDFKKLEITYSTIRVKKKNPKVKFN